MKIFLVDDHEIVRVAIRSMLEEETDMRVVGMASDGREAIKRIAELKPDVVIMDISMPGMNGVEATRQVVKLHPKIKVLVLSAYVDQKSVAEALNAGAACYMHKGDSFDKLVQAIRVISSGEIYLSPKIATLVVGDYRKQLAGKGSSGGAGLSPREREVLQLIAEGHRTKDIADKLGVSVKTIETQRQQIMKKVGVDSIAALTKYAIREGLTSL